jgi:hypothetical protein
MSRGIQAQEDERARLELQQKYGTFDGNFRKFSDISVL